MRKINYSRLHPIFLPLFPSLKKIKIKIKMELFYINFTEVSMQKTNEII